ncbi:cell surface protein [Penicillium lividum]|nr:cell surface protein [Penicillium lividum]
MTMANTSNMDNMANMANMTDTELPKSTVVVPLYIYPLDLETWSPLYAAIESNPDLEFLVIINPNSGPGESPLPDVNYSREIPRLNGYPNVYTVGYIRIDYCKKPRSTTHAEIDQYAGWSAQYSSTGLGVQGIFVDETPNHYTSDRADYLRELTKFIKNSPGILADRFVIHNPGTPPDVEISESADMFFISEEPYPRYRTDEVQKWLGRFKYDRNRSGVMINEVPLDALETLVHELRHKAAYIFVTEVAGDFYERFGPHSWGALMKALQS